jgi:hypothetical protein
MKRFPILGVLLLIPALILFGAVGCTTKDSGSKTTDKTVVETDKSDKEKSDKVKGAAKDITTPLDATVKGVVKYKGTPPERKEIAAVAQNKQDGPTCMKGDTKDQKWIVDNDGGVANVVISLAPPAGKKFHIDDKLKALYPKDVILDQPFCAYVPHVVALWPAVQTLVAKNDSPLNHNVKVVGGDVLGTKDITLTKGKDSGPFFKEMLKDAPESIIHAECSIHTWMNAQIALFKHPYFAVTNGKGEFEIKNVPIDTELTVYMWHESMTGKKKVTEMTFKKGDNELKTIDIEK